MNRARSAIVLGVIALVCGGLIWLFTSGGGQVGSAEDPTGDVIVSKGPRPPKSEDLADLTTAEVTTTDGGLVFEGTVGRPVPESLESGVVTFRWELSENGRVTWILSASVTIEPTASLLAQEFDYQSSTIDKSLPGELELDGDTVRVTLETAEIERFPESFTWTLETELDGDRTKTGSATARDVIPDEGGLDVGS